jgi:hypothetical protein
MDKRLQVCQYCGGVSPRGTTHCAACGGVFNLSDVVDIDGIRYDARIEAEAAAQNQISGLKRVLQSRAKLLVIVAVALVLGVAIYFIATSSAQKSKLKANAVQLSATYLTIRDSAHDVLQGMERDYDDPWDSSITEAKRAAALNQCMRQENSFVYRSNNGIINTENEIYDYLVVFNEALGNRKLSKEAYEAFMVNWLERFNYLYDIFGLRW